MDFFVSFAKNFASFAVKCFWNGLAKNLNRKGREGGAKSAKKIETVGADGGYNQAKLTLKELNFGLSIFCAY